MSASVCGDTAGVLLLSAVKYFFCLIFQSKNNMHSKTMKKHSGLQKMLWIKIPKMKPPIFFWPKVWRNQAINDLHFLFCARLSRTKLREQEYIKYVKLLTQEGKTNEVRLILKSADREVQNACAEYICETPVSNPAPEPILQRRL